MASLEIVTEVLLRMDMAGLAGQGHRRFTDDERLMRTTVYLETLSDLSDEDVRAACSIAIKAANPFYPTPGQLRALVRPQSVVDAELEKSCIEAYTAVLACYESGGFLTRNMVEERWGRTAAIAFMFAGAASFEWCEPGRDQAFRLKRWTESYMSQSGADADRLRAIDAGAEPAELGPSEAKSLLSRIPNGKA